MNKKVFATAVALFLCSFCVGMLLMAPDAPKASAAVSPPVPALESPPRVITVGEVLIEADPVQGAEKARPVAARPRPAAKAKVWSCGEARQVGAAGRLSQRPVDAPTVRTCGWI